MLPLYSRIKERREALGLSQNDLAKMIGYKTRSSITKIEKGLVDLPQSKIEALAKALDTTPAYLMGCINFQDDLPANIVPMPSRKDLPLTGTIACGEPILANQDYDQTACAPENVHADFVLRCKGDSMINARIKDGDIVYIQDTPQVENGEIAAVIIDNNEATLKRFYRSGNTVTLVAENNAFPPLVFTGEAINRIRIIGKAIGFTSTSI